MGFARNPDGALRERGLLERKWRRYLRPHNQPRLLFARTYGNLVELRHIPAVDGVPIVGKFSQGGQVGLDEVRHGRRPRLRNEAPSKYT